MVCDRMRSRMNLALKTLIMQHDYKRRTSYRTKQTQILNIITSKRVFMH